MLFSYLLRRMVKDGMLILQKPDGQSETFGHGTPSVRVKLHRASLDWSLALNPDLKIGEAYMDGLLTIEEGTLRDFLQILFSNYARVEKQALFRLMRWWSGRAFLMGQFNPLSRSRKNVEHHYDLPDKIYDLFLDSDRQYSCGYFTKLNNELEEAQRDKKRHIAAKLLLTKPGLKTLDIGSGWGGLALYLARYAQCKVTGVTLSARQYKLSIERAMRSGLSKSCQFALRDYRLEKGPYDRIVSVGMFEHVGRKNYAEYFQNIHRLLKDDGVCLLHTTCRFNQPEQTNPFIRKYIFPGSDLPSLSDIMKAVEPSGLFVTDVEILRLHYAETLRCWSERFAKHEEKISKKYGNIFYRMWQFYLNGCEMAFRYQHLMVAQIQLSKKLETVPVTRDYIYENEQQYQQNLQALG